MYPLVVVLGVATYEGRKGVVLTVLPLSVLGTAIAAYHSSIQMAPSGGAQCTVGCGLVQFRVLGLAVPNLSLLAFLLVTVSVLLVWRG